MRVKDGDTALCWLDEGDGHMLTTAVRYKGVDCPELSQPGGEAAAAFNRDLVDLMWVTCETRKERDPHNRLLGNLFVWRGTKLEPVDVTHEIIAAGHGTKHTGLYR